MPHAAINGQSIYDEDSGGDGDAVILAHGFLMARDDVTDRLGEITCPGLVIHGTEDQAISMDRAEQLAAGPPGAAGVVKVAGAHAPNLTNPDPVSAAILEFLDGL